MRILISVFLQDASCGQEQLLQGMGNEIMECLGRCKTTHLECSDRVTKIEQSIDNQLEVRI